jgi:hypothetical protein
MKRSSLSFQGILEIRFTKPAIAPPPRVEADPLKFLL